MAALEMFLNYFHRLPTPAVATTGGANFAVKPKTLEVLKYRGDGRQQTLVKGREADNYLYVYEQRTRVLAKITLW